MIFYLNHASARVLEFDLIGGIITDINILNQPHVPLQLQKSDILMSASLGHRLMDWLDSRMITIDRRKHIRGMNSVDDIINNWFFASLTDAYWLQPKGFDITWDEINLHENEFSSISYQAEKQKQFLQPPLVTPDCSLGGRLKKYWRIDNGIRILYKGGTGDSFQEALNEVIADKLNDILGLSHVKYKVVLNDDEFREPVCKCECFTTKDVEFIPAYDILNSLMQKDYPGMTEYEIYIKWLEEQNIENARYQVDLMIVSDFLLGNVDRHFNNFGVIRDVKSLDILDIAPMFDCGESLCHNRNINLFDIKSFQSINSFEGNESDQLELVKSDIQIPDLTEFRAWIKDFLEETNLLFPQKIDQILNFLDFRIDFIAQRFGRLSIKPYSW